MFTNVYIKEQFRIKEDHCLRAWTIFRCFEAVFMRGLDAITQLICIWLGDYLKVVIFGIFSNKTYSYIELFNTDGQKIAH